MSKLIYSLPLKRSDDSSHLFSPMDGGDWGEKKELDALLVTLPSLLSFKPDPQSQFKGFEKSDVKIITFMIILRNIDIL